MMTVMLVALLAHHVATKDPTMDAILMALMTTVSHPLTATMINVIFAIRVMTVDATIDVTLVTISMITALKTIAVTAIPIAVTAITIAVTAIPIAVTTITIAVTVIMVVVTVITIVVTAIMIVVTVITIVVTAITIVVTAIMTTATAITTTVPATTTTVPAITIANPDIMIPVAMTIVLTVIAIIAATRIARQMMTRLIIHRRYKMVFGEVVSGEVVTSSTSLTRFQLLVHFINIPSF